MKSKKSNYSKIDRRCFLNNCGKITIGATLLGISTKSYGDIKDDYEDYSYCIFKCPSPCTYTPSCGGCRTDETLNCTVKDCAIEKEMPSCAHCSELADCDKDLWINYPGQRQYALNKQKEWGLSDIDDKKFNKFRFKVYPTVTKDKINIENMSGADANFKLINLNGHIVKEGGFKSKKYNLSISKLAIGYYILNIFINKDLIYSSKIIKE
jgi:hypothetical protein